MEPSKRQLPQPLKIMLKKRFNLIFEKKWLVLSLFGLGIILALAVSYLLPKHYRASSRINFKYNSVYNSLLSSGGSLDNEMKEITSKENLGNTSTALSKDNINLSVSQLLNMLTLIEDKASTSIVVSAVYEDPEIVANVANEVLNSFSEKSKINGRGAYLKTLKILNNRIKEVQKENANLQIAQQEQSIGSLNLNEERIVSRLTELESELENIEIDNQFYTSQLEYLTRVLENKFPAINNKLTNIPKSEIGNYQTILERLETKKRLSEVEQKLRNFLISYPWTENYNLTDLAKYRENFNKKLITYADKLITEQNIDEDAFLKKLLMSFYNTQIKINSIDLSKSIIFNLLNNLEDQFNRIPYANLDNARQVRSARFYNKLLIKLKSKELKLKEKEKDFFAETDSIIKAEVPDSFFSPNIPMNLIWGGLLGLIIGIILAINSKKKQLEYVTDTEDLEDAGYKIISQIPNIDPGTSLLLHFKSDSNKMKNDPDVVRAFQGIETFLKYGNLDKPLKTIMVTSGHLDEGKSVIASNIAITLANQGSKVLLVDADLKNPNLNKYFKIKSTPSLAHYLFRKKELNEIIRNTHFSNLDLITCIEFPQNPAVIVTSERMKNFMSQVKTRYEYIVYDTASLCELKEIAGIAKDVDEVILVTRANKTKFAELSEAEKLLEQGGVTTFNVVLNDVNI